MSYRFESLDTIFRRTGHLAASTADLAKRLEGIQQKGGIESKVKNGKVFYCNAPLVVGMYEYQQNRLTPEFIRDFNDYTSTIDFGLAFLSSKLPQMRTIPVSQSIRPQHHVSNFDEVMTLLQEAAEPFVITVCICRKKKSLEGSRCQVTDRQETCLSVGDMANMALKSGIGREISRDKAISIIERNQKQGLVLQPSNAVRAEFICSCCGCCCGMLRIQQNLPKPLDFWASNYYAAVNSETCSACGVCGKRCQVGAVNQPAENQPAVVNRNRCIGCGVCVPVCPKQSLSLVKKPAQVTPPPTREDLHDIIAIGRRGRLGKLKLAGKLVVDSVRTGHMNLLR